MDVILGEFAVGLVYCGLEILLEPLIDELLAAPDRLRVHALLSDVRFFGLRAIYCNSHICVGLSMAHHLEGSRVQTRLKAGCQFLLYPLMLCFFALLYAFLVVVAELKFLVD